MNVELFQAVEVYYFLWKLFYNIRIVVEKEIFVSVFLVNVIAKDIPFYHEKKFQQFLLS